MMRLHLTRTFAVLGERVSEREVIIWYFQHTIVLFCLKYRRRLLQDEVIESFLKCCGYEYVAQDFRDGLCDSYIWNS